MRIKSSLKKDNPADKKEAAEPTPLHFDFEVDPKTDPNSPEFDIEAMREFIEKAASTAQIMMNKIAPVIGKVAELTISASDSLKEFKENLPAIIKYLEESAEQWEEFLKPYYEEELKKPKYGGKTLEEIKRESTDENGIIMPGSLYDIAESAAIEAAEKEIERQELLEAQQAGREQRREIKKRAQEQNAVMTLQGGQLPLPSASDLWRAFTPENICLIGTLDRSFVNEETGLINKRNFEQGEIVELGRLDAPIQAYMLLSAITANTVENVMEEYIKGGEITFYVKGVLDAISRTDTRSAIEGKLDNEQLTLDRKTAGVLYLENLFKPLQQYIGKLPNGSRYSVFNYIGYNADNDTMTIKTPYIYQLWKRTQGAYFERQNRIDTARATNKRPAPRDYTPLEINTLFKGAAFNDDPVTLEIATYITNRMLAAGKNKPDATKTLNVKYRTIVNECPTLKTRIDDIESNPDIQNPAAHIAGELRKFTQAYKLIMNPEKCDARNMFEFVKFEPTRQVLKKGKRGSAEIELIPPTKRTLDSEICIEWRHREE